MLFKKIGFWGAYAATKTYGFPRIYRHVLKTSRKSEHPELIAHSARACIETPSKAFAIVQRSYMYTYVQKLASGVIGDVPPVLATVAQSIVAKSFFYKTLKELEMEGNKHNARVPNTLGEDVESWLASLRYGQYAAALAEEGYDCVPTLRSLSDEEWKELVEVARVKRGHALRMRRDLLGESTTTADSL